MSKPSHYFKTKVPGCRNCEHLYFCVSKGCFRCRKFDFNTDKNGWCEQHSPKYGYKFNVSVKGETNE